MVNRGRVSGLMLNFHGVQVSHTAGSRWALFERTIVMGKKKNETNKPVDKHADFLRVQTPRVNKALNAIELLANCAGAAYAPTKSEVADMFATVRNKVDSVEKCYTEGTSLESGFAFGA